MKKEWRLVLDGKRDGFYNMALDEAVLLNYPRYKIPTLRIYGWNKPFVTLGYNQNARETLNFEEDIPFIRRMTGGACILHNEEVTYSITCALEDLDLPFKVKESYKILCSFLINFYSRWKVEAKFAGDIFCFRLGGYENFCFSSREEFDLTINGKKIGGNAQKRKKRLLFQHGSIPQNLDFGLVKKLVKNVNDLESKTTSLNEVLNKDTDFNCCGNILADSFKTTFGVAFVDKTLLREEMNDLDRLIKYKYKKQDWNDKNVDFTNKLDPADK